MNKCHIIKTPVGSYIYIGSVPHELCRHREATSDDIMAQRAYRDAEGRLRCASSMSFQTAYQALQHACNRGVTIANADDITA